MKEKIANRLLTVKSLVTLTLTLVFAYLAITHQIAQDFMTVYAVVIAFYYGTQATKEAASEGGDSGAGKAADTINNYYQLPEGTEVESAVEVETDGPRKA